MEQHYRMTLQDAIAKYHAGDITIKGLIHFYILIKCKPGWKIKIDYESIKQILPVSKSSFYHVISCLKKEGVIAWEAVKGILVSRITQNTPCSDNPVTEPDSGIPEEKSEIPDEESEIPDEESGIPDEESGIPEEKSEIPDYEPPKPATVNHESDSPDLDQSLDQLLPNSLSEKEREDFIEFGKKKASSLPKPPALPIKWIKKHHKELFSEWQKQSGVVPDAVNNRWENHPQKEEWLNTIRTKGNASFILENGSFDSERNAFWQWAEASNLIWGMES